MMGKAGAGRQEGKPVERQTGRYEGGMAGKAWSLQRRQGGRQAVPVVGTVQAGGRQKAVRKAGSHACRQAAREADKQ